MGASNPALQGWRLRFGWEVPHGAPWPWIIDHGTRITSPASRRALYLPWGVAVSWSHCRRRFFPVVPGFLRYPASSSALAAGFLALLSLAAANFVHRVDGVHLQPDECSFFLSLFTLPSFFRCILFFWLWLGWVSHLLIRATVGFFFWWVLFYLSDDQGLWKLRCVIFLLNYSQSWGVSWCEGYGFSSFCWFMQMWNHGMGCSWSFIFISLMIRDSGSFFVFLGLYLLSRFLSWFSCGWILFCHAVVVWRCVG